MITKINGTYILEKFPGKGGWTFARIPEIAQDKSNPFGWVKVNGSIDTYKLNHYKLMPMGGGKLFLPVKAAIRKLIKKEAGEYVHIIIQVDNSSIEVPRELIDCLLNEPQFIYKNFQSLTDGQRKEFIDWIYDAKTEDTKAKRILKMIEELENI